MPRGEGRSSVAFRSLHAPARLGRAARAGLLALGALASACGHADPPTTADLFKSTCAACHGDDGGGTARGRKLGVRDMRTADWQRATDAQLKGVILDGASIEGKAVMDGNKNDLEPAQIDALVGYVRAFAKK